MAKIDAILIEKLTRPKRFNYGDNLYSYKYPILIVCSENFFGELSRLREFKKEDNRHTIIIEGNKAEIVFRKHKDGVIEFYYDSPEIHYI
jgi:hypothetical protein